MTEALVMAGGGTKGAFEVGALEFLTRDSTFAPGIIAGTSAGSIIAGTLAQGRTGEDFHRLARVVRSNVLAVTDINTIFDKQDWLKHVEDTPLAQLVDQMIAQRSRPALPMPNGTGSGLAEPKQRRRHRTWRTMSVALGNAPAVVRAGRAFFTEHRGLLSIEPLGRALHGEADLGIAPLDESVIAANGIVLRLVLTSLGQGVPRYVTEHGVIVGRDSRSPWPGAGQPGVIEGILASSSVPMLFPPRRIGDDVYTDGGMVQNIPVEAAVGAGAGDVTALLASPLSLSEDGTDYANASLVTVFARSVAGAAATELQRSNLRYPLADGARLRVIGPTVDVVGAFEVEPGLITVDFGYGWLRAAEVCAELDPREAAQMRGDSDTIASERERAWFLEEQLLNHGRATHIEDALRRSRQRVADAVTRWMGSGLEPISGMELWGLQWEEHRTPVPDELLRIALP